MIRVLFFGTSSFAVPTLDALAHDSRFSVVGVVTQPDRAVGRHAVLTPPPIKTRALELGLPVLQFERVKSDEAFAELSRISADIGVVASFGQIMPERILSIPAHGCLNVHGSLLPAYRGASPVAQAILNGDTTTGVTIIKMDALMDHGPILAMQEELIHPDDRTTTLLDRLARIGANLLVTSAIAYVEGTLTPVEQDHAHATKVSLLTRESGKVDATMRADVIERMIRAYDEWPGVYLLMNEKRIKLIEAHVVTEPTPKALTLTCAEQTYLEVTRLQPEGKQAMTAQAFQNGNGTLVLS